MKPQRDGPVRCSAWLDIMKPKQEPKYRVSIPDGALVNRQSGEAIPDDEPLFVLRGRDVLAVPTLRSYLSHGMVEEHRRAVELRLAQFAAFAKANPDRMKEPDTVLTDDWRDL